jgi:hypothetical protein
MAEHDEDSRLKGLDYWRLCDELSVVQAALLIVGQDPAGMQEYVNTNQPGDRPSGYDAAKTAISNALRSGAIAGRIGPIYEYDINGSTCGVIEDSIDPANSRVEVASLRNWLAGRGFRSGFFFPEPSYSQDYLDPRHPRYAPKLAAAVQAWISMGSESVIEGKSPKQRLAKWLREHATKFGMTDDDGKPNETGIEEAAKVANWQPIGGAPKTPGG